VLLDSFLTLAIIFFEMLQAWDHVASYAQLATVPAIKT
jgi:hypothetical protein